MLETVRQYGLRMLSEEGELEEARQRHADYFVLLAEQADEGLRDARQAEAVEVLDSEHDNLRGALRWATNSSEKNLALRLVGALGWYWFMRGHWKESWRWFHQANDLKSSCDPIIRAKAICRAGGLQIIRGNLIGTVELVEEAVDICREFGDEEGLAWSLSLMGQSKTWADKDFDKAMPYFSESVERFRSIGNDWGVAFTMPFIGQVLEFQEEYEQSVRVHKEGISIFERLGDKWNQSYSLYLLGNTANRFGDIHLAELAYRQSLVKSSSIKDKVMHAHALKGLGQLAFQKDDREKMETINLEALEALQKIGDENCTAFVLRCLGEVSQRKRDYAKALELLGRSLHIYQKMGQTDKIGFVLDRFASLAAAAGKKERAAKLLGGSSHLEGERGMLYPAQYKDERKYLTKSLREILGERDFEKLFQEGASMSLEDAVSYALRNTAEE
jgi:tetratricopeptide (TPR) repeat protein